MGSFTFKWDGPAEEVYVTGTFDQWSKSQQLEKVGEDSFEKTVPFPEMSEKIYYKFVVDGNWITDDSIPIEKDSTGNHNNVLTPDQLAKDPPPTAAIMNNVTPDATTAQLAASVPLEEKKEVPTTTETATEKADEVKTEADKVDEEEKPELSEKAAAAEDTAAEESKPDIPTPVAPGGFPETPANDLQPDVPTPIAPGGFPETPASDLDKPVGINPMPAADNALNPITLAPGERIPDSVVTEDVDKNVKLDKESYEKADELPGEVSAAQVPPITETMIPESSLPITGAKDVTVSSAAPDATTAILAADAPIETKQEETPEVPEIVKESQEKAGVEPEASASPEEVKEKAEVEAELLDKVPEAPSTAEGTAGEGTDKKEGETTAPDAVSAVAAAPIAAAVADKDAEVEEATGAATELPDPAKQVIDAKTTEEIHEEASPEAPAEAKQSSAEASTSPEAAASTEAAAEKKEVEKAAPVEPKAEEAAKSDAAPTPAEAKPAEEVPRTEEAKPAEETAKAAANGTEAPAAESSSAPSTTEKKKNRLSVLLSKIKQKLKH